MYIYVFIACPISHGRISILPRTSSMLAAEQRSCNVDTLKYYFEDYKKLFWGLLWLLLLLGSPEEEEEEWVFVFLDSTYIQRALLSIQRPCQRWHVTHLVHVILWDASRNGLVIIIILIISIMFMIMMSLGHHTPSTYTNIRARIVHEHTRAHSEVCNVDPLIYLAIIGRPSTSTPWYAWLYSETCNVDTLIYLA